MIVTTEHGNYPIDIPSIRGVFVPNNDKEVKIEYNDGNIARRVTIPCRTMLRAISVYNTLTNTVNGGAPINRLTVLDYPDIKVEMGRL